VYCLIIYMDITNKMYRSILKIVTYIVTFITSYFVTSQVPYWRWKPQYNMLTTTSCTLHHTSVVNSVCCVMPWYFFCHCHVSFVPALQPSYKDIKNAMAVSVLKYWECNTVLPYESYSTLQGVVMVECGTMMEKWAEGKTKTFFSSTFYHKSIWSPMGLNLMLRVEKPESNHLSNDTINEWINK